MIQVPIEAAELGVVGAGPFGCCGKHLISKDVNMLVNVLVWKASGMRMIWGWATQAKLGRVAARNSESAVQSRPRGPATLWACAVQKDLEPEPRSGAVGMCGKGTSRDSAPGSSARA